MADNRFHSPLHLNGAMHAKSWPLSANRRVCAPIGPVGVVGAAEVGVIRLVGLVALVGLHSRCARAFTLTIKHICDSRSAEGIVLNLWKSAGLFSNRGQSFRDFCGLGINRVCAVLIEVPQHVETSDLAFEEARSVLVPEQLLAPSSTLSPPQWQGW
eukprot:808406-Amphidinium_carterae.1